MRDSWLDGKRRAAFRLRFEQLEKRRLLTGLSLADVTILEGAASATLSMRLDQSAAQTVHVRVDTVDGDALAGRDYQAINDFRLSFSPGEVTKTLEVPLYDNSLRDGDRQFSVQASVLNSQVSGVESSLLADPDGRSFLSQTRLTPDGETVLFSAFYDSVGLYSVPIDGSSQAVRINGAVPYDNRFHPALAVTPDSSRVLFLSDGESPGNVHLYSAPVDGSAEPVRLSGPLAGGSVFSILDAAITADSERVLFSFLNAETGAYDLCVSPLDGSAEPRVLIANQSAGVLQPLVDSPLVIFTKEDDLYSIPLDGSEAPKLLTGNAAGDRINHYSIGLSKLGQHAVFHLRTDQASNARDLFSVPVDGSTEAIRLASDVGQAKVEYTADGRRVIYWVDKGIVAPRELWTVPIDGSAPAARLHQTFGSDQGIYQFEVSPDGQKVAFSADIDKDNVYELYVSPADASSPPWKVIGFDEGAVNSIHFSKDGRRVLASYTEQVDAQWQTRLVSAPVDGATSWVYLDRPASSSGNVSMSAGLAMSGDGSHVYYVADHDTDEVHEIYAVPVDGSRAPVKLNQPLPPDHQVYKSAGKLFAAGDTVVYGIREGFEASKQLHRSRLKGLGIANARVRILDNDVNVADFGDAPHSSQSGFAASYPTSFHQDGARHTAGELFFGAGVDIEQDGVTQAGTGTELADGDDVDEPVNNRGIDFLFDPFVAATETLTSVALTASQSGYVNAWVDFNRDGDWNDFGEQVLRDQSVIAGTQMIPLTVPATAEIGETVARFRISTQRGLLPTGAAIDGEVEDLAVHLRDTRILPQSILLFATQNFVSIHSGNGEITITGGTESLFRAPASSIADLQIVTATGDSVVELGTDVRPMGAVRINGADGDNTLRLTPPTASHSAVGLVDLVEDATFELRNFANIDLSRSDIIGLNLDRSAIERLHATAAITVTGVQPEQLRFANPSQWRVGEPQVVDGQFRHTVIDAHANHNRVVVTQFPQGWTNVVNRYDVNNNGAVSPIDALQIINELAIRGDTALATELPLPTDTANWRGVFFDTSEDHRITPLDALLVINKIARDGVVSAAALSRGGSAEIDDEIVNLLVSDQTNHLF